MVLGAGDTSEKAAKALQSRGVRRVLVANRTHERAESLAAELGGCAVRFDDFEQESASVDVLISSVAVEHPILTRPGVDALMAARKHRPLFLIDLGVPRNIDPAVNELDNVYLYNVDDLQSIAETNMAARRDDLARCDALIAANVLKFEEWLRRLPPDTARNGHSKFSTETAKMPTTQPPSKPASSH